MINDHRVKDHPSVNPRIRFQEDLPFDYDSVHDGMCVSSSIFEFQKAERAPQRVPVGPFSKPAPSKWDDAQKWIASPTSNRPKGGQGVNSRKAHGSKQPSTKVIVEFPDQRLVPFEEPDTKRIDPSHSKKESAGQKFVSWEVDSYPTADPYTKPVLMIENTTQESASKDLPFIVLNKIFFLLFSLK